MYLWQRRAGPRWWQINEQNLRALAGDDLAIIERPDRKWIQIQVACQSRRRADQLLRLFGGRAERLPRDWIECFSRGQKFGPLRIGKRLIVINAAESTVSQPSKAGGIAASRLLRKRNSGSGGFQTARPSKKPIVLMIPAGAAFGTGQHATTAMCLRLLEELTRGWDVKGQRKQQSSDVRSPKSYWSLLDLGTGSGILALAAKLFGAKNIVGVDEDPNAISTAKANARLNKINKVRFRVADVRRYQAADEIDIVVANLFSELLIEIVPKLARVRWLILSGVLRAQERELVSALRRHKISVVKIRRRGRWIALLAGSHSSNRESKNDRGARR